MLVLLWVIDKFLDLLVLDQDADEGVKLYWGIAADGSAVICDDLDVMKASCAKSFAPFPAGKSTISNQHIAPSMPFILMCALI